MEALFMCIAFGFLFAVGFLSAFFWAVNNGQYDDQHTPALRMVIDDSAEKQQQNI
jgi:cbb3-type cytochrome oxidase maturation protein